MSKFFTVVSALLLLLIAVGHALRAYYGIALTVGAYAVPVLASWICAGILAFLAIMILVELPSRKKKTAE
jgi:hypothetical protein